MNGISELGRYELDMQPVRYGEGSNASAGVQSKDGWNAPGKTHFLETLSISPPVLNAVNKIAPSAASTSRTTIQRSLIGPVLSQRVLYLQHELNPEGRPSIPRLATRQ